MFVCLSLSLTTRRQRRWRQVGRPRRQLLRRQRLLLYVQLTFCPKLPYPDLPYPLIYRTLIFFAVPMVTGGGKGPMRGFAAALASGPPRSSATCFLRLDFLPPAISVHQSARILCTSRLYQYFC